MNVEWQEGASGHGIASTLPFEELYSLFELTFVSLLRLQASFFCCTFLSNVQVV